MFTPVRVGPPSSEIVVRREEGELNQVPDGDGKIDWHDYTALALEQQRTGDYHRLISFQSNYAEVLQEFGC